MRINVFLLLTKVVPVSVMFLFSESQNEDMHKNGGLPFVISDILGKNITAKSVVLSKSVTDQIRSKCQEMKLDPTIISTSELTSKKKIKVHIYFNLNYVNLNMLFMLNVHIDLYQ